MSARTASQLSTRKPAVALILQGGGALGAYHIGAYEALAEHDLHPVWVSGISIGAFNAAVIAGNRPDERVVKLDEIWHTISWPDVAAPVDFTQLRMLRNRVPSGCRPDPQQRRGVFTRVDRGASGCRVARSEGRHCGSTVAASTIASASRGGSSSRQIPACDDAA